MIRATWAVAMVATFSSLAIADETGVPVKVAEPAGVGWANGPAGGGIPVRGLRAKSVSELAVVDSAGKAVPAQISPMVTRENGELDWVLVDLLTDLKPSETRRFTLTRTAGKPAQVPDPVVVGQTDDAITLGNGLVQVVLSKKRFNLLENVWVDRNGDGRFSDDEKMLSPDQPAELALVRGADGVAFSTRDGKVDQVTLEDPGPVRTTVRIDGQFGACPATQPDTQPRPAVPPGTPYLKYTARVTMWAGRPDIKVLYALRNTNPELATQEKIRSATVAIRLAPLTGLKHYLVGAGQVHFSQISADEKDAIKGSQWHHKVELSQVGPPEAVTSRTHRQFYHLKDFADAGYRVEQFQPGNRTPVVDVGFMCGGWLDLGSDTGGCLLWLRDFTYDTPKRMAASADGMLRVDLVPEYDGNQQPYYADGGYWLGDRSYRTWELNFHFHGRPLVGKSDWDRWKETFSCYQPPGPETAAAAGAIALRARHPLVLVTTPEEYTRAGTLWGEVVSVEEENAAAKAMGRTKVGPVRPQPAGAQATEFLHYENFHYRSEWDEPGDAILEFLRTGERDFYKRAHSFGRNYRDFGVPRNDGLNMDSRQPVKQPGAAGPIDRWGKFCGCHKYGSGLFDLWLTSGDRSYLDAGLDFARDQARPAVVRGGFGDRGWGRQMIAVIRACQVTGDPKLKAWLLTNCRPPTPDEALRADGRALLAGKHQASWMTGLCAHAVWHNYLLNRDSYGEVERDDFEDGIIGVARNVARFWYFPEHKGGPYYIEFDSPRTLNVNLKTNLPAEGKPGQVYAGGGGAAYTLSCIDMMTRGYLLTGDRRLLEQARLFWDCVNGDDRTVQSARLQDFVGMGSGSFWARQLIYAYAHPRADSQGPAAVNDLAAEPLGGGKVKLTWTAPGDAGGGKVVRYQVKHAPRPLVSFEEFRYPEDHNRKWTWWAGYNVAGEPRPAAPGSAESMTVESVAPGPRFFCLVSRDDSSNESGLSNVVEVQVK